MAWRARTHSTTSDASRRRIGGRQSTGVEQWNGSNSPMRAILGCFSLTGTSMYVSPFDHSEVKEQRWSFRTIQKMYRRRYLLQSTACNSGMEQWSGTMEQCNSDSRVQMIIISARLPATLSLGHMNCHLFFSSVFCQDQSSQQSDNQKRGPRDRDASQRAEDHDRYFVQLPTLQTMPSLPKEVAAAIGGSDFTVLTFSRGHCASFSPALASLTVCGGAGSGRRRR